jgi:hypothetical protein
MVTQFSGIQIKILGKKKIRLKNAVFFDVTRSSPLGIHRRLGDYYGFHLQGLDVSHAINQQQRDKK